MLRVWRSRWFALTEDGLLSYWLKARSAAGDRGMAKCTRQTRDITSVLSHEGFFAIDWKDGSTWNMRAPADSSKQFQVNWVMQLKQMTVGAAFGRSPRAASASAVVAVGHGDSVDSTFGGSSQSLDDNGRGQATGGARAVPVFRQLPPPPPERRDDVVATKETSASSPSASLSSSSCSSSTLPSSCISSGGTPSTSLATAASHVGPPSLSLSFSTQNDSRDQHCVDSDPVIRGNATTRHCPGCNSSRLRIKPICGACQGDGFFVVRETPDKTDLLTRFKRGPLQYMFQTSVVGKTALSKQGTILANFCVDFVRCAF